MILIPPLRTRRLSVQFKELSIGAAIRLAGIHPRQHEFATSEFLKAVVDAAATPTDKHVADPRLWTVEERTLAVCHYLAAVADNGEADFQVGEAGKLTDYLDTGRDYVATAPAGQAADDKWQMVPLTGMAAEVIEGLAGDVDGVPAGRMHWLVGTMAAQMVRVDAEGKPLEPLAPDSDAELSEWIRGRMRVLSEFPESAFSQLLAARAAGMRALAHFFVTDTSDDGLVCLPARKGEGGEQLPPARFPVDQCISPVALELAQPMQKPTQ
jgi:hypothetical protein